MDDRQDTKTAIASPFSIRPPGKACLVMIYGRELGRRWQLDRASFVLGRGENVDITLDLDNVSRRHCEVRIAPTGGHVIEDLKSTNGTFVNSREVKGVQELRSGDHLKVGSTIFKYLDGDSVESQFHEEIYRMMIVDGLTNAYNRRYLLEFLEREMSRAHRYQRMLSVMLLDIDHFKRVNDTFGHIAGDHVLREVAGLVRSMVRKEECFARYGGEEFALVMPEAEQAKVLIFAEKIRRSVSEHEITFEGRSMGVTMSLGVSQLEPAHLDPLAFIASADERLYRAKHEGRNRVVS